MITLLHQGLVQLKKAGISLSPEVFPKQAIPKDLGNLIKLPWGIHRVTGNRTVFLADDFTPLPDWGHKQITELQIVTEGTIDSIIGSQPVERLPIKRKMKGDLQEILGRPLHPGERRPALIKLVGYLKYRRVPEEIATELLLPWTEMIFQPTLPQEEIIKHIHGIYQRYGAKSERQCEAMILDSAPEFLMAQLQEVWK